MRTGGIVLCGGRSSRMGQPKAWLPFGGEVLLQRVVRIVREAVDPVIVVAAPGQDVPPLPSGIEIVRDPVEGYGPLAGLAAGLTALEGQADAAYLSGCDLPFLTTSFVRGVCNLLGDAAVAVPFVDGYLHPLAAVYRLTILPHVEAMLAAQQHRVLDLFERDSIRRIESAQLPDTDPECPPLWNINTPEQYTAALQQRST